MGSSVEHATLTFGGKSMLARTFAKVLHLRVPFIDVEKVKDDRIVEKIKDDRITGALALSFDNRKEKVQDREALEAMLAKLFASISTIKAAYSELQLAQAPYDPDAIHFADEMVVSELKNLSELKQCFLKKQFDPSPETSLLLAEIQEQRSLLKSYEIMGRKLECNVKLKESEITFLEEKFEECNEHNKTLEKRLNPSGLLSTLDNLHLSGLSPTHFIMVLRQSVKSIQSHVRLMISEMELANWDLDAAATAAEPSIVHWEGRHRCFAFVAYVSREMFDGFSWPNFSLPSESLMEPKKQKDIFFSRFMELKSVKPMEFISRKPKSAFAKFCRIKYLQLIHPKLESALFGSLHQRNLVNSGLFPETTFFASFAEMAKGVWLLHCLAFSFEPAASIFQVKKKCRFSEVYMESVNDEPTRPRPPSSKASDMAEESNQQVGFTVIPGFGIGKTVVQSQVYLSPSS